MYISPSGDVLVASSFKCFQKHLKSQMHKHKHTHMDIFDTKTFTVFITIYFKLRLMSLGLYISHFSVFCDRHLHSRFEQFSRLGRFWNILCMIISILPFSFVILILYLTGGLLVATSSSFNFGLLQYFLSIDLSSSSGALYQMHEITSLVKNSQKWTGWQWHARVRRSTRHFLLLDFEQTTTPRTILI